MRTIRQIKLVFSYSVLALGLSMLPADGDVPAEFQGLWAAGRTCKNAIEITGTEYLGPYNVKLKYEEATKSDEIVFVGPDGKTGRKFELWPGESPESDRLIHRESMVAGGWMKAAQATEYRRCESRDGVPLSASATVPQVAPEPPSDMAEAYCYSYLPIVEQALMHREQGTPIAMVQEMAEGAIDIDYNLYSFLVGAIQFAYEDPGSTRRLLSDGNMLKACAQQVRGY